MTEIIKIEKVIEHYNGLVKSGGRVLVQSLQMTFGVKYMVAYNTMQKLVELGIVEFNWDEREYYKK
jgi:hypothetical protein